MSILAGLNRVMRPTRLVLAIGLFVASAAVFCTTALDQYRRYYGDPGQHPDVRQHLAELDEQDARARRRHQAQWSTRP